MRIPHIRLEEIRSNPDNYKEILQPTFFGNSKYLRWKNGINHYHKTGDLNKSIKHFVTLFENNFVQSEANLKEMEDYIHKLEAYVNSFKKLNNGVVKMNDRLNITLNNGNQLYGEISRLDLFKGKRFEAYLLTKKDYLWQTELRFPIIQHHYAKKYSRDYKDVSVGVYCIELGKHITKCFDKDEIEEALTELNTISDSIT